MANPDCFCQKSKYNACEVFQLEEFSYSHMDTERENIYICMPYVGASRAWKPT